MASEMTLGKILFDGNGTHPAILKPYSTAVSPKSQAPSAQLLHFKPGVVRMRPRRAARLRLRRAARLRLRRAQSSRLLKSWLSRSHRSRAGDRNRCNMAKPNLHRRRRATEIRPLRDASPSRFVGPERAFPLVDPFTVGRGSLCAPHPASNLAGGQRRTPRN